MKVDVTFQHKDEVFPASIYFEGDSVVLDTGVNRIFRAVNPNQKTTDWLLIFLGEFAGVFRYSILDFSIVGED